MRYSLLWENINNDDTSDQMVTIVEASGYQAAFDKGTRNMRDKCGDKFSDYRLASITETRPSKIVEASVWCCTENGVEENVLNGCADESKQFVKLPELPEYEYYGRLLRRIAKLCNDGTITKIELISR